jgi:hypothetical protein
MARVMDIANLKPFHPSFLGKSWQKGAPSCGMAHYSIRLPHISRER